MIIKSGDIEVIVNEPLFSSNSVWYPGYAETKSFQVKNRGNKTKQVQIEALSENETKNLSQGLSLEVRNDASCVYGCNEVKTLRNFFDAGSVSVGGVPADDNGKVFTMVAVMLASAEDKYQSGKVGFDLRIGFEGDAVSTVTAQGTGSVTSATGSTSSTGIANNINPTGAAQDRTAEGAEETGEILGQEVMPVATNGTVMGETTNRNDSSNNWWLSWWWPVVLSILVAIGWWWNRRKKGYTE